MQKAVGSIPTSRSRSLPLLKRRVGDLHGSEAERLGTSLSSWA